MFLSLLVTQNLMKCFGNSWACIIHHEKSKTTIHLWFGPPNIMGRVLRATCWAKKPVLQAKNSKWQNFLRICSNSEWRPSIMCCALPMKPRPKFGVDQAFSVVLALCSNASLGSSFSLCKHSCEPNREFSYDEACPCLCFPSPTTSPNECSPDEHWFSINRCQITGSLSGQFSVFPDFPQLIKCMLIF